MRRPSALALSAVTLLIGIFLGSQGWPLMRSALAQTLLPPPGTSSGKTVTEIAHDKLVEDLQNRNTPLHLAGDQTAKIIRLTGPSVVHIQAQRRTKTRGLIEETGSGVVMRSSKLAGLFVVTNRHVVDGAELKDIAISLSDGRLLHPTETWQDQPTDVACLRIAASDLPSANWGDSEKLEIGHFVLAVGSPFGLSQSVTMGIISAKGRRDLELGGGKSRLINQDFLQTDAAINPGNSGGPLINLQGEVVGINTAIASNSGGNEGIGFSIPSNLVRNVVEQLLQNGKVSRAYLGVKLDKFFNVDVAARLKLDRVRGARIVEVYANTPAARTKLQVDDVVLSFDNIEVQDEDHLVHLVSLAGIDRQVKVVLYRDGKRLNVEMLLSERPDESARATQPGMGTKVDRLGLTVHQLDAETAKQLGLDKSTRGLLVLDVDQTGPASGEVQQYDLIEEVARTPVSSITEISDALSTTRSTENVVLKIRRRQNGVLRSQIVVLQP